MLLAIFLQVPTPSGTNGMGAMAWDTERVRLAMCGGVESRHAGFDRQVPEPVVNPGLRRLDRRNAIASCRIAQAQW